MTISENNQSYDWDKEMALYKERLHNEKSLYEENLIPLKRAFNEVLMKIPCDKRVKLGGVFIDEIWSEVYLKHLSTQPLKFENDGSAPDFCTSQLRPRRERACSPYYTNTFDNTNVDAKLERLALLVHHDCVLKPEPNESAFKQVLRTIMMQGSPITQMVGTSGDDWDYLKNKSVEPVKYNVVKKSFKGKYKFIQKNAVKTPLFSLGKSKSTPQEYPAESVWKTNLINIMNQKSKSKKLTLMEKIKTKTKAGIDWCKSLFVRSDTFTSRKKYWNPSIAKIAKREDLAIEYLKSARGQV